MHHRSPLESNLGESNRLHDRLPLNKAYTNVKKKPKFHKK
ncbi:hypothetical protein B4109_0550 [Geobacillus stearothermophilus]|uniref:Uncharacterized protein n=1 Tax=Geobacillus stearothermophilus TaxID=1422 RepID=A0A150MRR8_GEOSE|nr:hypothetical protein B4109_0550 [Geobacillus stearothermophilus]